LTGSRTNACGAACSYILLIIFFQSMKWDKVAFWTSTVLFSALLAFSAVNTFVSAEMVTAFTHLGFPNYFRIEFGSN
jgi:hypothetical protein